jgi:hypothetical protein
MIVRTFSEHLELITQPDHARLAGRIAAACRVPDLHTRGTRDELLVATDEHDRGWVEYDDRPAIDEKGRPHDFIHAPDSWKFELWPRAVNTLGATSAYAAALVAQHAYSVYQGRPDTPAWRAFFARMTALRDEWLARATPTRTPADVDADYPVLRLADLMSLTYCLGLTESVSVSGPNGALPLSASARGERGWASDERPRIILTGTTLIVTPDPFAGAVVPLIVRRRTIPNRPYASDSELRDEVARAPESWLEGIARGAS